jgi:hypothetical protein
MPPRNLRKDAGMNKRPPEKLPDPWLFDSESLLRELDRCRELVLQIPATTHAVHFASNIAIDALWNLRENLRYLLLMHREAQRSFARKAGAQKPKAHPGKEKNGAGNVVKIAKFSA